MQKNEEGKEKYPMLFGSRGIIGGQGLAARIYLMLLLEPMQLTDLALRIYPSSKQPQLNEIRNVLGKVRNTRNKRNTLLGAGYVERMKNTADSEPKTAEEIREARSQFNFVTQNKERKEILLTASVDAIIDYVSFTLVQRGEESKYYIKFINSKQARHMLKLIHESLTTEVYSLRNPSGKYRTLIEFLFSTRMPLILKNIHADFGEGENVFNTMTGQNMMEFILNLFANEASFSEDSLLRKWSAEGRIDDNKYGELASLLKKTSLPRFDFASIADKIVPPGYISVA